jgi:hypothetical protein
LIGAGGMHRKAVGLCKIQSSQTILSVQSHLREGAAEAVREVQGPGVVIRITSGALAAVVISRPGGAQEPLTVQCQPSPLRAWGYND